MLVDLHLETDIKASPRVQQLEALFDCPIPAKAVLDRKGELPIDERDWNIGLVVGPSGSGKSSVARDVFGEDKPPTWKSDCAVVDEFAPSLSMTDIARVCQAVGFNTVPAWMRPYRVLSTGEQFRVEMARRLLEGGERIIVDEFTSVVDRQVAQIGSHAVQKWVRRKGSQFVAVTCHYDVIDWLQPDWVLEPATMTFAWRSVQPRPAIDIKVSQVPYSAWRVFAPFHYLTASLHRGAKCFCLFANGSPATCMAVMFRPHPKVRDIMAISRSVTLPDWQGLGLAFTLKNTLGAAYKAVGMRLRGYPAHPIYVRSTARSPFWKQKKEGGTFEAAPTSNKSLRMRQATPWMQGSRPNAVFEYVGPPMESVDDAERLLGRFRR